MRIAVSLAPRLRPVFAVNDFGSDWGGAVVAAGAVLLAIWAWVLTRWVAAAQHRTQASVSLAAKAFFARYLWVNEWVEVYVPEHEAAGGEFM